jgi:hypothetical protein
MVVVQGHALNVDEKPELRHRTVTMMQQARPKSGPKND